MSNRDTRGTARSRPGARPAPVVSPTRRSERVAERVVSPSPPRGRARVDTPAPPPPRHSRAQEPEESDAPRGWLPLVPRYGSPRAALLFFTALLATAAQALCLLPVAWPRDSPMRWLCQGPWAARLHPASALSLFNAWLLFRELHRPGRAVAMLFAHIALGSLAGGCAPARKAAPPDMRRR